MSEFLLVAEIGLGTLALGGLLLVALVSMRAVRRGIPLLAEMRASSFAFKIQLQPYDRAPVPDDAARDERAASGSARLEDGTDPLGREAAGGGGQRS